MTATLFMAVALLGVPQDSGFGRREVERLVRIYLKEQGPAMIQAVARLARRPKITRTVIDDRLKTEKDAAIAGRLAALRTRVLTEGLKAVIVERASTGLVFSGQWKDLAGYDPEVGTLLLELVTEELERGFIREAALNAIADVGLRKLCPELTKITADILNEDWLIESAGLALAELGDTSWLEQRIAPLKELVAQSTANVSRRYAAYKQLARYYYRLERYTQAIESYQGAIAILEGRIKTIDSERAEPLRATLYLTYYNTACSACKKSLMDDAFSYLEKAIASQPTPETAKELELNIQQDGDLRRLREDPRYRDLRRKLQAIYRGKKLEI